LKAPRTWTSGEAIAWYLTPQFSGGALIEMISLFNHDRSLHYKSADWHNGATSQPAAGLIVRHHKIDDVRFIERQSPGAVKVKDRLALRHHYTLKPPAISE